MDLHIWLAFCIAAIIILVIPGPTILLVVSQAITHGRKSVIPLVAGVTAGDFTAMTFSLLGLGAILATSSVLFSILKWIGALYLIYLGIRQWRSPAPEKATSHDPSSDSGFKLFKRSYIVTSLNPKGIAFFIAFMPQFIVPGDSTVFQMIILGSTFLVLATINAALYALFAGYLRHTLVKQGSRKWFNRCGGSALIGAGCLTAAMQRSS